MNFANNGTGPSGWSNPEGSLVAMLAETPAAFEIR